MHDHQMDNYLRIALKLNQTNLESTIKFADSENTALIDEIINPTPGLIVDDEISLSQSFNSDLDPSFSFSNKLDTRLDDLLEDANENINSVSFPPEPDHGIPNDPLYTEDFFIDESFTNILYPGGKQFYFKQPLTDDRTDFEITTPGSNIFKSPSLTFTTIERDNLKTIINNIIEDLGLNISLLKNEADKKESKQKITLLKNLNKRVDMAKNKDIEEQLQSHEWLNKLIEDQLKDNTSYNFGENYENRKFTNKFPYITTRKRKLQSQKPLASEEKLKDFPSYLKKIPTDNRNKIESTKEIFSNIIGQIPPENYKKFKINLDSGHQINISQMKEDF